MKNKQEPTLETIKSNIANWSKTRNILDGYHLLRSGPGFEFLKEDFNKWADDNGDVHIYLGCDEQKRTMFFYLVDSANDATNTYNPGVTIFEQKFVEPFPSKYSIKGGSKNESNKLDSAINVFIEYLMNTLEAESPNIPAIKKNLNTKFQTITTFINSKEDIEKANSYLGSYLGNIVPTFRWLFYGHKWFEELQKEKEVVQVFKIKKEDFKKVFDSQKKNTTAFLSFAQKEGLGRLTDIYIHRIDLYIYAYNPNEIEYTGNYQFMMKHISGDVATPCPPYCMITDHFNLLPK